MPKDFIFFFPNDLPKKNAASSIQFVNCCNAAHNIGYPAVLVYLDRSLRAYNPMRWAAPYKPVWAEKPLERFYGCNKELKAVLLSVPWPIDHVARNLISSAGLLKNYLLPKHVFPNTKLFYSRDWNFVKLAVRAGTPSIFESHFPVEKDFERDIVESSYLKLVVANTEFIKNNSIEHGMPSGKVMNLHNGVNTFFFKRLPTEADSWRKRLLKDGKTKLAVYAGALLKYKGIETIIDTASKLTDVQFVLAGGPDSRKAGYQKICVEKGILNVRFLGYLTQGELAVLFQAADVLIFPCSESAASLFTSPLKFFEYLASGTPIVMSDISFLGEFKHRGLVIAVSKPDSYGEFVDCVKAALRDYPRRETGYAENIEFAKQFTWEKRMERILTLAGV